MKLPKISEIIEGKGSDCCQKIRTIIVCIGATNLVPIHGRDEDRDTTGIVNPFHHFINNRTFPAKQQR